MFVSRTSRTPGGAGGELDERLVVVGGRVQLVELGLVDRRAAA